jgi:hypothetical protein
MAVRYVNSGQAKRDYNKWYNSLSPENQKRVDTVIVWAVKEAIKEASGQAAAHFGGPGAGTIVKKAVELAMNALIEYDESASAEVHAMVETKIATALSAKMTESTKTQTSARPLSVPA